MKKFAILLCTFSSLLSSQLAIKSETLFNRAAQSIVQNMTVSQFCEALSSYSDECITIFIAAYLNQDGYEKLDALSDMTSSLFVKKELTKEQTTFFSEGKKEGHYRPTRFSNNPFFKIRRSSFCLYLSGKTYSTTAVKRLSE